MKHEFCPTCGRAYTKAHGLVLKKFLDSTSPISQCNLSKELKISYRQIIRILKQLQKAGIIELDHREPNRKGGLLAKNFWRKR